MRSTELHRESDAWEEEYARKNNHPRTDRKKRHAYVLQHNLITLWRKYFEEVAGSKEALEQMLDPDPATGMP